MTDVDKVRYIRCKLVVGDVLAQIMRDYLDVAAIPYSTIENTIMNAKMFRDKLRQDEFATIQTLSTKGFKQFDISLMHKVVRFSLFSMLIFNDVPTRFWKSDPIATENTFGDNLQRIKKCRDRIDHNPNVSLTVDELQRYFQQYIDIVNRAAAHLKKNLENYEKKINDYRDCSLDSGQVAKISEGIKPLKKFVEVKSMCVYIDEETEEAIRVLRESHKDQASARIIIYVETSKDVPSLVKKLNDKKDQIFTTNITMQNADEGSVAVDIEIKKDAFSTPKLNQELHEILGQILTNMDVEDSCDMYGFLEIDVFSPDNNEEDDTIESDEEFVIGVDIQTSVFEDRQSTVDNFNEFLTNVVTNLKDEIGENAEIKAVLQIQKPETFAEPKEKELTEFLFKTNLQHLLDLFRSQGISLNDLLKSSDADLKELGIKAKGDRFSIIRAAKQIRPGTTPSEQKDTDFIERYGLSKWRNILEEEEITETTFQKISEGDLHQIGIKSKEDQTTILSSRDTVEKTSGNVALSSDMDIETILQTINLQRLIPQFEEEKITTEMLLDMSEDDLNDIKLKRGPIIEILHARDQIKYNGMSKETEKNSSTSATYTSEEGKKLGTDLEERKVKHTDEDEFTIQQFLADISLQNLFPLFEKEAITMEVIHEINDKQLEKIGVEKLGHRLKILKEIRRLSFKDERYSTYSSDYDELFIPTQGESNDLLGPDEDDSTYGGSQYIDEVPAKMRQELVGVQAPKSEKPDTGSTNETFADVVHNMTIFKRKASGSLIYSYDKIIRFLMSSICTQDLRNSLDPEFSIQELEASIIDLRNDSFPIVVTGETCSGKSTFVNLLLGEDLLPMSPLACTSIICTIHNSKDKKKLELRFDGDKENTTIFFASVDQIRNELESRVSKRHSSSSDTEEEFTKPCLYAEIYWPLPDLPTDVLIVDTPGVGPDDPELTQKLYQYLPNALALIYILNTPNAGGVQSDRILLIRNELQQCSERSKLSVFDPERAIFVCNKWDQIHQKTEEVYTTIRNSLEENWMGFKPDKLFTLSAIQELKAVSEGNSVSEEYRKVLQGINDMVPATVNEKYSRHIQKQTRFFNGMLQKIKAQDRISRKSREKNQQDATQIDDQIQGIEKNLAVQKDTITTEVIKHCSSECKKISSAVFKHIHDPHVFNIMFNWSAKDLPDSNNLQQLKVSLEKIFCQKINLEMWKYMANERKRIVSIENFIRQRLNTLYFEVDDACYNFERLVMVDQEETKYQKPQKGGKFRKSLNMTSGRSRIALALSAPIIIPTALAIGAVAAVFVVPIGVAIEKMKEKKKLRDYHKNKVEYANKQAKKLLEQLTEDKMARKLKEITIQNVKETLDNFFNIDLPRRITSGKNMSKMLKQDHKKEPKEIRQQNQICKTELMAIQGFFLAEAVSLFYDDHEKTEKASTDKTEVKTKWFASTEKNEKYIAIAKINELRALNHNNILRVYGMRPIANDDLVGFDMFVETFQSTLEQKVFHERLRWHKCKSYIKDALEGLSYLHQMCIAHTDVRLATIVISTDDEGKIAECETAKYVARSGPIDSHPVIVPPEVLQGSFWGMEGDIFQIGIVLWETYSHNRAFCNREGECEFATYEDLANAIRRGERPPLEIYAPGALISTKIHQCWDEDPNERPSAKDISGVL